MARRKARDDDEFGGLIEGADVGGGMFVGPRNPLADDDDDSHALRRSKPRRARVKRRKSRRR